MSAPAVSAVIPVFNGARFLRSAVESVLAQSAPPGELIVVDDGSTDDSLAQLQDLPRSGIPLRVLRQANSGQSAARNHAAREAVGEHLAFLDQDDAWHPMYLELMVAHLAANPRVGWVYSDFDEIDYDGGLVTRAFLRAHGVAHPKHSLFDCVANDLMVLPSASVLRRAAFTDVGGFDERLSGYEDDDIFVRFFRRGWEQVFVDRPLVRFRIHDSGSSASRRFMESRMIYAEKLAAMLPDDPRMMRYYVRDAIAPRFFQTSLDDYVRACSARRWNDAAVALEGVNRFGRLRRPGWRLSLKLAAIQWPRLFRLLVASNDTLPSWVRPIRNPTVTLR
ncbi:MAG: glycosyltransferase family A protein [Acidobacteriota bacterium]